MTPPRSTRTIAGPGHGLRSDFSMNRPEAHDVLRRWRGVADSYEEPSRVLLGETWVLDLDALARFYGSGEDELHLALNVPFVFAEPGSDWCRCRPGDRGRLPPAAWPLWNGSNHDAGRFASRWCDGDERRARAALLTLLTLRGTPLLYYGDEDGMREVTIPRDRLKIRLASDTGPEPGPRRRTNADAVDARGRVHRRRCGAVAAGG